MSVMISAIGVSYLLQNLATYVTGGQPMNYPTIPPHPCPVGHQSPSAAPPSSGWSSPPFPLALVIVLTQLINHTKVGMAMRAVAKDFETSQLMGIKINSVISVTFVIGSFLAAVGAALYFTNYQSIVPLSGALPGLRAFVAAVFGGIGSIPGAVIGAFLIGICENFVKIILPFEGATTFVDAFTFALLIIILVVKPTGLFGEKSTDRCKGGATHDPRKKKKASRGGLIFAAGGAGAGGPAGSWIWCWRTPSPTSQLFTVLKKGAVYAVVSSMNLLNGFTASSPWQAGFMLLGAYTYAILTVPVSAKRRSTTCTGARRCPSPCLTCSAGWTPPRA